MKRIEAYDLTKDMICPYCHKNLAVDEDIPQAITECEHVVIIYSESDENAGAWESWRDEVVKDLKIDEYPDEFDDGHAWEFLLHLATNTNGDDITLIKDYENFESGPAYVILASSESGLAILKSHYQYYLKQNSVLAR